MIPRKWAAIYANDEFICFQTFSGFRSSAMDLEGKTILVKPDDAPHILGQALHDALLASRFLRADELDAFFSIELGKERYETWVAGLMRRYEYSSRRGLFKRMKRCSVEQSGGVTTLRPLRHEKLESWSGNGIDSNDHVQLSDSSSFVELGQGVLLALSRCTD